LEEAEWPIFSYHAKVMQTKHILYTKSQVMSTNFTDSENLPNFVDVKGLLEFDTITEYNEYLGVETIHPLISIVDFSHVRALHRHRTTLGFYAMFFKDKTCGDLRYGRGKYDYTDGALVTIGPNQMFNFEANGEEFQPEGIGLLFHPDIIRGTELAKNIRRYTFFSYEMNEALHLSVSERATLDDCIDKIRTELNSPFDRFTKKLIVNNLEMMLDYCLRFFNRQFTTRATLNKDVLTRLEDYLNDYFRSGRAEDEGLPNVTGCASVMHLSPNYFSDLIKKETGKTALDFMHCTATAIAKDLIYDESLSLSEIAYRLGFKYPQHFSRFFKRNTGMSPKQYRDSISVKHRQFNALH